MTPEIAAAVLNVAIDASDDEIRQAFTLRARMSHPDRFAGASRTDLAAAAAEFGRVTQARDVLMASRDHRANLPPREPHPSPEENPWPRSTATRDQFDRSGGTGQDASERRTLRRMGLGAVVAVAAALFLIAISTANHWTKVDIAEHPETFHTEQYLTGQFDVVEGDGNPCWAGQDWTDCINARISQYNAVCAGVSLSVFGKGLCDRYKLAIEQMQSEGGPGYYVATVGGYGNLSKVPVSSTRTVSNNDYRPAITHEAVCYLGFIGECK